MQRIYVDFARGESRDRVEVGYADERNLCALSLQDSERVVLHDDAMETQGILHQEQSTGKVYWYAIPDWTTRQDYDVSPLLGHVENQAVG